MQGFNLRENCYTVNLLWQERGGSWEHEGSDRIATEIRKSREINAGVLPPSFFFPFPFRLGFQSRVWVLTTFRVSVPSSGKSLWETPSQMGPEVCLLGDSKPSQANNQNEPSKALWVWAFSEIHQDHK